jgi:hypothetical protein
MAGSVTVATAWSCVRGVPGRWPLPETLGHLTAAWRSWWPWAVPCGRVVPKRHPPLPCVLHIRRRFSLAPDSSESSCLPQGSSKIAPPSTCPGESTLDQGRGLGLGARLPRLVLVPPSWFGCHLDGFLLRLGRWACCIPSPTMGFTGLRPPRPTCLPGCGGVPTGAPPSRAFPSRGSRPRVTARRAPLPSHLPRRVPTSRPCSTGESVAASRRCRRGAARCSPGLPRSEATRTTTPPPEGRDLGPAWSTPAPRRDPARRHRAARTQPSGVGPTARWRPGVAGSWPAAGVPPCSPPSRRTGRCPTRLVGVDVGVDRAAPSCRAAPCSATP